KFFESGDEVRFHLLRAYGQFEREVAAARVRLILRDNRLVVEGRPVADWPSWVDNWQELPPPVWGSRRAPDNKRVDYRSRGEGNVCRTKHSSPTERRERTGRPIPLHI